MSSKTKTLAVAGSLLAAVICGLLFCWVFSQTAVPTLAYGTEGENAVKVSSVGWFTLIATLFGAGGFSLTAIVAALQKALPSIVHSVLPGMSDMVVDSTINTARIAMYLALSKQVTDAAEKAQLIASARMACDVWRDNLFPIELQPKV